MSDYHSSSNPDRFNPDRYNGHYNGLFNGISNGFFADRNQDDTKDRVDIRRIISLLTYRKWSIIAILLIFTAGAYIYGKSLLPVYQSSATMMITDMQNQGPFGEGELTTLLTSNYGIGVGSSVTNQLEILRSRRVSDTIAEQVLQMQKNGDIELDQFPILWRDYPEDDTIVSLQGLSNRIRNNSMVERSRQGADIVNITFDSHSPEEAAFMVNKIIDVYSEFSTDQTRRAATAALEFLEDERSEVIQDLESSEIQLKEFMENTRLMAIDEQTTAAIERMTQLEIRRQEIGVERIAITSAIESYEEQLETIRPGLKEKLSQGVDMQLDRLQFKLAELQAERLLILARNPRLADTMDSEPQIVEIDQQINVLRREINRAADELLSESDEFLGFLGSSDGGVTERILSIRGQLLDLYIRDAQNRAQINVINQRLEEENEFIDELPESGLQYARLKRDVTINEEMFLAINRQVAETALWEQTQFGMGRPLDYGLVPGTPASPNIPLITLLGFLLGGVIAIGFAIGRETFNTTIDGTAKLKKLNYPLLTVIPDLKGINKKKRLNGDTVELDGKKLSTSLVSFLDSISPGAEAFRRLHNNILYSKPDEDFKTIMITSPTQGDGKTTTASNLAITLAEAGKKVLLMDTDLRRPNIHSMWGEKRQPGIMEVLFDHADVQEAIQPSLSQGVDILAAGRRPPNPSAINRSEKLKNLINGLKKHYDHIIIDTAPYGIITDAAPLMRLADGVVITTRFNETKDYELDHTIEQLERIKANILGLTLTAYKHEKSSDYHYTKQYYYSGYKGYETYAGELDQN